MTTSVQIIGGTAVLVTAMVAALLVPNGATDEALGAALRATARTSLALFWLAATASSLRAFWPRSGTAWLLRNRRELGLAFGVSHFLHLGLIAARATGHTDAFWMGRTVASVIPGATAYLFLAAMTITSFRGPRRWLGPRRWKLLHTTGIYVITAVFAGAYATRAAAEPEAALGLAVAASIVALRGAAWWHRRRVS